MAFLISAVILVVLIFLLKYLPVKSGVLIEGVFKKMECGSDFNGRESTAYWFENYCKDCFERRNFENNSIYGKCLATVPTRAWNRSTFIPEAGDSIKIIARKNIFGTIKIYKIVKSDFLETYRPKQRALYEEHFRKLGEALDKRGALEKGMSVEEYRESKREETIRYAMEELGMSREEVIKNGMHEWGYGSIHNEARRRKLIAELGREATHEDVLEEDRKIMQKVASNYPNQECLEPYEIEEYGETGTLHENRLLHLNGCTSCYIQASINRNNWVLTHTPPGPECFSKNELHIIHETGTLPKERLEHTKNCKKCKYDFDVNKTTYLERVAPIPREHCPSIVFTLDPKDIKAFYARKAELLKL